MGSAGVAADDQRPAVLEAANHLRPMAAALRAELRRCGFELFGSSVMNHDVIYSRNVIAKARLRINLLISQHLVLVTTRGFGLISCRNGTRVSKE